MLSARALLLGGAQAAGVTIATAAWGVDRLMSYTYASTNAASTGDPGAYSTPDMTDLYGDVTPAQPQLVEQFKAAAHSSRRQRLQQRKLGLIRDFQRAEGDVGSPEVQIALLTDKIRDLSEHFLQHKKDYHSMRGLQGMLNQRRKLLSYLRRSNFDRYAFVLHKLGLKDTYAKQERYDKYRVGSWLGAPAEALKRYGNK